MSFEITKICRTCLALEGALLSIYDSKGSSNNGCIADMLAELSSIPPKKSDGMPEKICLACISEINRCYSFKIKCDNSDRTLRQLLNIDELKDDETNIEISEESRSPAEKKAIITNSTVRIVKQDADQAASVEPDVIYSVQSEEELEASYYVIGSVENENENENENEGDDDKGKLQPEHQDVYEQLQEQQQENESDERSAPDSRKEELKCPECPMTFVRPRNLSKHIRKVHENYESTKDPKQDPSSPKDADQKSAENTDDDMSLLVEMNQHIIPPIDKQLVVVTTFKHKCPRCGAGFAMPRSLKYHIQHNKCTEKQYSCTKCHKVFMSVANLRSHIRSHSSDHTCNICNETFKRTEELHEHKAQKHSGKLKNQCPTCLKVFTMLSTLKDHMRTHSGERPFLCPICGKGFSQNPNLKQHLMRHNKTKPFKCEECDNSYVSKGELFSHMRSHTGDHPFSCDMCKASFTTSSSLVKHKRTHTGERPYACEFCPMRFTALNTLKNHRRTHTGERPFKCKYCRRGFAQKSDCAIHMRTHTGERRYICQVCGSAFHQLGTLRTHMKTHRDAKDESDEIEVPATTVEIIDAEDQSDPQKDEHMDTQKANTSVDEADLGDDELLHYAIEECSSENNDYNGE